MRYRQAVKVGPQEQELLAAIEEELKVIGGLSAAGPWKDAEAIWDGVNRRLNRPKPVSVRTIHRRLLPRS
jgi:hypothetical protein